MLTFPIRGRVKEWDEEKHPRDEAGRFTESIDVSVETWFATNDIVGTTPWTGIEDSREQVQEYQRDIAEQIASRARGTGESYEDRVLRQLDMRETWQATAGDEHYVALARQELAKEEFGLDGAADPIKVHMRDADDLDRVRMDRATENYMNRSADLDRSLMRATYEHTQDELRERGIRELTLHRGMAWDEDEEAPQWVKNLPEGNSGGHTLPLSAQNALSSWTSNRDVAYGFGTFETRGANGIVISATVPADRIYATSMTGQGSFDEREVIALATELDDVRIEKIGWS